MGQLAGNRYEEAPAGYLLTTLQPIAGFTQSFDSDWPLAAPGQRMIKYLVIWELVSLGSGSSYELFMTDRSAGQGGQVNVPSGSVLKKVANWVTAAESYAEHAIDQVSTASPTGGPIPGIVYTTQPAPAQPSEQPWQDVVSEAPGRDYVPAPADGIPTWVWIAGGGLALLLFSRGR